MTASPTPDSHGQPAKKATINGLAIIGFFGLVVAGMLLAVYAARYVPQTLARLSSAVYLSSDQAKNGTATTTPSAPAPTPAVTTIVTTPQNPTTVATSAPQLPNETGYTPKTSTYTPPRVISTGPQLYGYPDLAVTDVQRSGSSRDMRVTFIVRNVGTNAVSGWSVRVRIEGEQDAIAYGGLLYPNGYQNFNLRATDLTRSSPDLDIDVDYQNAVVESNENNNDYSTNGSSSNSDNVSCNLDASDTSVNEGDRITLDWDTDGNPNYASINQGIGRVDEDGGSERVTVDEDTTFRLTVRNSDGDEDTCSVTVRAD